MSTRKPEPDLFLHHVGIAVRDLDQAVRRFQEILGITEVEYENLPERGLRIAVFHLGNVRLELISPTRPGTAIDRFLEKRGDGLHHLSFGVRQWIKLESRLQQAGVRIVDGPRPGAFSPRVIFTDPRDTGRVLLEFMEMPEEP